MAKYETFEITFILGAKPQFKSTLPEKTPKIAVTLATALYYQELVRTGEAKNYRELAQRRGVSAARLGQLMLLVWLAPDIQQELLYLPMTAAGRYPISEWAVRPIAGLLSWNEQRRKWSELKKLHLVS